MTAAKFHTATELGDLARAANVTDMRTFLDASVRLIDAVLETEAYTEQQTALAITAAQRRWPEQWSTEIHDHVGEEETVIDTASFYATPGPLTRAVCYAATCDKPGHWHKRAAL